MLKDPDKNRSTLSGLLEFSDIRAQTAVTPAPWTSNEFENE